MKAKPTYIDLTMPLDENVPVFPGHAVPIITQKATLAKEGWSEKELTINAHHGTHVDFPAHMFEGGKAQCAYPIDTFIGKGKIFDVRNKSEISVQKDVLDANVTEGDIVLFCTGRSAYYRDFQKYHTEASMLTEAFADALIEKKVKAIGLDAWSVDKGKPFTIHKKLLANDILIVENMVNLEKLLGKAFTLFVAPINLQAFDGSPCRAFAEVEG